MLAYLIILFVALVPGVLLRLPPGGSKLTVAAVHGLVFALVWHLTHKMVSRSAEGFRPCTKEQPCHVGCTSTGSLTKMTGTCSS